MTSVYELYPLSNWLGAKQWLLQVVRKETAKLTKDLAAHEKEEVKLQEKKKHAVSKQKKLKKSITDVRRTQVLFTGI